MDNLQREAASIERQINYVRGVRETIDETKSALLERDQDKAMLIDIEQTLIAAKLLHYTAKPADQKLAAALAGDFSLDACISFIEAEVKKVDQSLHPSNSLQEWLDKDPDGKLMKAALAQRTKILRATLENLQALSVFAARMAEHLADFPGNQEPDLGRTNSANELLEGGEKC